MSTLSPSKPSPVPTIESMALTLDALFRRMPQTVEEARLLGTDELLRLLGDTPLAIVRLLMLHAAIWTVLEERDPALLKPFIQSNRLVYKWVREIAHKRAAAEAICEFGVNTRLVRLVTQMPIDQQKILAADPVVEVLDASTKDVLKRDLRDLDEPELDRVFDLPGDRVRTVQQQAAYLRPLTPPPVPSKRVREVTAGRLKFNPASKRIRTIGPDADLEDMVSLLRTLGYAVIAPG